jgi:hypothetical protein
MYDLEYVEAYSVKKVQAEATSPKETIKKQLKRKVTKAPSLLRPQNLKDEPWYGSAWERFSVSKKQSTYRTERASESDPH